MDEPTRPYMVGERGTEFRGWRPWGDFSHLYWWWCEECRTTHEQSSAGVDESWPAPDAYWIRADRPLWPRLVPVPWLERAQIGLWNARRALSRLVRVSHACSFVLGILAAHLWESL